MLRHECWVGQRVSFTYKSTTWEGEVTRVNPKNIKVATYSPMAKTWNVHPSFLTEVTSTSSAPTPVVTAVHYVKGNVVKYIGQTGLFVVCGDRASGYQIAPLGGDRGVYYTGVPAGQLELVNFELAGV